MIFIFSTSFSSLAWSSENYDDCIFKNMKGIGSDLGAKEIIYLCKAKHINTKSSICFDTDAQTINGIIFLQDLNELYTGNNLCEYTSGQVKSKGYIKDGKLIGKVTNWHENGQIFSEEYYKDGKKDGKWTEWYENGQIFSEGNYKDGKKDDKWTYWQKNDQKIWLDGQIFSEEYYLEGNLVGETKYSYHENGQILSEEYYKDGKKDGKWTEWYENGLKWLDRNYKNGKRDGKWTEWYANGLIKLEENYKDGKKET